MGVWLWVLGGLGVLAVVGAIIVAGLASDRQKAEIETARAAKAEKDALTNARIARDEAVVAANRAQREREEEEKRLKEHQALVGSFLTMTPARRAEEVRLECRKGECVEHRLKAVHEAAHDAHEQTTLSALIARERLARAERDARERATELKERPANTRATFAAMYDRALLEKHMSPDGVEVDGTSLRVRGWFCTRGFVYGFSRGQDGARARDVGFTEIICASSSATWTQEL